MSLPEQLREWQEIDKRHRAEGQKSNIDRLEVIAEALAAEVERLEKIEKVAKVVIDSASKVTSQYAHLEYFGISPSALAALEAALAAEPPAVHIGRTPQSVLDAAKALGGMPPADEPCEKCGGLGRVECVVDGNMRIMPGYEGKPCSKCGHTGVGQGVLEAPVCKVCGDHGFVLVDWKKIEDCPECGHTGIEQKGKSDD